MAPRREDVERKVLEGMSRKWGKIAGSSRVVPMASTPPADAALSAYNTRVMIFKDIPVPKFLLDKVDDAKNFMVHAHVQATMFDTKGKAFFGNTWSSKGVDIKTITTRGATSKWNGMPAILCAMDLHKECSIFTASRTNLSDVKLVLELVMTVMDPTGTIRGEEYGVCWAAVPMNTSRDFANFSYPRDAEDGVSSNIFSGTPRLLLFGSDEKALDKARVDKAQISHITMTHKALAGPAATLMVENEQVGGEEGVPGLDSLEEAKLQAHVALELSEVAVTVSDGVETRLREYVDKITGQKVEVTGMVLQVGVHNGRRFVGKGAGEGTVDLKLKAGAGGKLTADKVELGNLVVSNAVAVVALLFAEVKADGKQSRVCLGWTPIPTCESRADGGRVVVGNLNMELRRSSPMISVSSAVVFTDEAAAVPTLALKVACGASGVKTVLLKDKVDQAAGQAGEEEVLVEPQATAASKEDKKIEPLKSFKLVCDLTPLGRKGKTYMELDGVDLEGTHADLLKRLRAAIPGEETDLRMEYVGKGGTKVMIASPSEYDGLLDVLESDWIGARVYAGEVKVSLFHPEGYVKAADKDDFDPEPQPEAKKEDPKKPEEPPKPQKKPFTELTLVCDAAALPDKGGGGDGKVQGISADCSWKEASSKLRARFKVDVTLEYAPAAGAVKAKVDSAVSWKKLVQELEDDWTLDAPKLNGAMAVTLVPIPQPEPTPPPRQPEAPKPVPAAAEPPKVVPPLAQASSLAASLPAAKELAPLALVMPKKAAPLPAVTPAAAALPVPAVTATDKAKENEPPAAGALAVVPTAAEDAPVRKGRAKAHQRREALEDHPPRLKARDLADMTVSHPRLPLAACALPMSRGLKARLLTSCVSDVLPKFWQDVPFIESGEEMDPVFPPSGLSAHMIIISFLAVQAPPSVHSVYLTLSFYHFEPIRTRTARLRRDTGDAASAPALLQEPGADESAGVTLTLTVDPEATGRGEGELFDRYLSCRAMQVQVWDADTCHQIGSLLLDLRGLRRKGRDAIQTALQVPMLDPAAAASGEVAEASISSKTACPIPPPAGPGGGLSGAAKGSVFVRLVNVGRESSAPPTAAARREGPGGGGRVLPLTEERGVTAYEPVAAVGGGADAVGGNAKALQMMRAFRINVAEEAKKAGADPSRMTKAALREALLAAKLNLTVGQVDRVSDYLGEQGAIDLFRLTMRGERLINASAYEEGTRKSLVQACVTLLGTMVPKYGSLVNAHGQFCDAGQQGMRIGNLAALLADVSSVAELNVSEQQQVALMRLMGAGMDGVPVTGFTGFFEVAYGAEGAVGEVEDQARRRKLERWRRVKEVRHQREDLGSKGVDERSLTIVAARLMREAHKTERITSFLEGCLQTTLDIRPSYGAVCFFTQALRNPFAEERVIAVAISDEGDAPGLEMVTDKEELRDLWRLACLDSSSADFRVASSALASNFLLAPLQEIYVPFKLRYESSAYLRAQGEAYTGVPAPSADGADGGADAVEAKVIAAHTAVVSATSVKEGMPLRVLSVAIKPEPFVVDQSFLFYGARGDWVQKRIVLDVATARAGLGWRARPEQERLLGGVDKEGIRGDGAGRKWAWTDEQGVYLSVVPHTGDRGLQEIEVSCRCGEAGTRRTFHIVLYNEASRTSVYEIWRVTVASLHSTDAAGLLGQDTSLTLTVRGGDKPVACRAMSSNVSQLSVEVDGLVTLGPSLSSVPLKFSPTAEGWRDYIVNFVAERRLVSQWLVIAKANLPAVTKRYDIRVEYGIVSYKKIMYVNPGHIDRTFRLVSSHPTLLSFRMARNEMMVPSRGREYINMKFTPGERPVAGGDALNRTDIYVFINDEKGANEECLCISCRAY